LERNAKESERLLQEITRLRAGNVDDSLETRKADLNRRLSDLRNKDDEANRSAKKELHAKVAEAGAKCLEAGSRVNRLQRAVAELEAEIHGYNQKREKLLQSFKEIQQRKFISKTIETICPTCGQEIPPESIEAAQAAQELQEKQFNHGKAELLKEINEKGKANNEAKQKAETLLEESKKALQEEENNLNALREEERKANEAVATFSYAVSAGISQLEKALAELNAQANRPDEAAEKRIAELASKREAVIEKQREAQNKLNDIEQNRKCQECIREQQEKEAELSATYTSLQRQAYLCDRYSRCLTDYIDRKVADKFKLARFTFFRDNITNDGVKECCEVVIDGVPYHDINNAKKINIGLDIINTLCKYYNVSVPVFVDNAEGVTQLIDTDLQIIRLVVSPDDKTLRVEKA
jgi:DNA repair exonuclease SbcCD ATPase subunit